MNIFCCSKPLWLGESWLCTLDQAGEIKSIEPEITKTLPIHLGQLTTGTLNVLKQMIEEIGGKLLTDRQASGGQQLTALKGVLLANLGEYSQLLQIIRSNKWRIREVADPLERVLSNVLKSVQVKPKILLEQPNNLTHFVWDDDLVETMARYPLVQNGTPIGVYFNQFAYLEDMETYVRALQSKGYGVVLYVHNDEEFKRVRQLKTNYILYC